MIFLRCATYINYRAYYFSMECYATTLDRVFKLWYVTCPNKLARLAKIIAMSKFLVKKHNRYTCYTIQPILQRYFTRNPLGI